MTAHTALSFQRLSKRYPNGVLALQDLDLEIPRGGFVALVGRSGSGKSTLLRLGAGLEQPTDGAIVKAPGLKISVVFQDATLMPWACVADNVALPLELSGLPRATAKQRAQALLAQVGLSDFAAAYPAELSGGMRMRVSFARALVTDPDLLFLDEPFAALDELTRQQLNDWLLALWQARKPSVLFITHSIYEAAYLAERIYVLSPRPGRILERVAVPAPYPRNAEYRLSSGFGDVVRVVSAAVAKSGGDADAA